MNEIIFQIPKHFTSLVESGELLRSGALLKEVSSGKIVAHLQETGVAQQLISQMPGMSLVNPLSAAVSSSTGVYNTLQLEQLKQMMAVMQGLQYASIGVSLAGIGVSVVGFVVISKKLKNIERSISYLSERVDAHFQRLYDEKLRWVFSSISGLFEKADIAKALVNPKAEYLSVGSALADHSALIRGELEYRLSLEAFDEELFNLLTRTLLMTNAARVEVLLAADEIDAAHKTSKVIAKTYQNLFDPLTPYDLTAKRHHILPSDNPSFQVFMKQDRHNMGNLVSCLRDVTDAAMTKPLLIETLDKKGIRGSDYITALRQEKEHPILLLSV